MDAYAQWEKWDEPCLDWFGMTVTVAVAVLCWLYFRFTLSIRDVEELLVV